MDFGSIHPDAPDAWEALQLRHSPDLSDAVRDRLLFESLKKLLSL